jgi:hypothetical protein
MIENKINTHREKRNNIIIENPSQTLFSVWGSFISISEDSIKIIIG